MLIRFKFYLNEKRKKPYKELRIQQDSYVPFIGDIYEEKVEEGKAPKKPWIIKSRKFSINPYGYFHYVLDLQPLLKP